MNKLDIGGDNHGHITQNRTVNITFSTTDNKIPNAVPWLIAFILLCVEPFIGLPHGFFTFLRIITCGAFAYAVFYIQDTGLKFIIGTFAVLYNPFCPIQFDREIWRVLNVVTAFVLTVLYIFLIVRSRKRLKKTKIGFREDSDDDTIRDEAC